MFAHERIQTVATVLTVYGIETLIRKLWTSFSPAVATVLTVYGIETARAKRLNCLRSSVATVLTVYGIETFANFQMSVRRNWKLQQYLPFTVLKLTRS